MAEDKIISRNTIHMILNQIKKAEIENAKTLKYTDKEMVSKIGEYILREVKKQKDIYEEDSDIEQEEVEIE